MFLGKSKNQWLSLRAKSKSACLLVITVVIIDRLCSNDSQVNLLWQDADFDKTTKAQDTEGTPEHARRKCVRPTLFLILYQLTILPTDLRD